MENNINSAQPQKNKPSSISNSNSLKKYLVIAFWVIGIVMGAWQAWDARHHMGADGISYIDISDAYIRGDWKMAINAYWSPLYSWLIGLAMIILKPSPYYEFTVVHLINFIIFLCAMGSFHFFLLQLIKYHRSRSCKVFGGCDLTFPEWVWIALGYSLFLRSSLNHITIIDESPDMCLTAFLYLASGILLSMRRGSANYLTFVLLGVVLGFGYLAKAIMFPLAFIFLSLSIFSTGNLKRAFPRAMIAVISFLLIAGPFIIAISNAKGRITWGDTGKFNYWLSVLNDNKWQHWDGTDPNSGTPAHPVRKIFDKPSIYEFETPFMGTYPVWYDPSYWHEGLEIRIDLSKQLHIIRNNLKNYYNIFYPGYSVLIFGSLILYLMSRRRWLIIKDIAEHWILFIPSLIALAMYCLISVIPRYPGPFIPLLFLGIFSCIRLPDSEEMKRLLGYVTIVMVLVTITITARHFIKDRNPLPHVQWQVSESLNRMGILPGDKVASIGHSFAHFWARLARVQIIAEIPIDEVDIFWGADSSVQSKVIETFAATGAKAIVTELMPSNISIDGWQKIAKSNYYVYMLQKKK